MKAKRTEATKILFGLVLGFLVIFTLATLDKQMQDNAELNLENQDLLKLQKATAAEADALKENQAILMDDHATLSSDFEKTQAELAEAKDQLDELSAEKKELEERLTTSKKEGNRLEQEVSALQKELEEERERPRRVTTTTPTPQSTKAALPPQKPKASAKPSTISKPNKPAATKTISGQATAYTANCKGCTGITASGQPVQQGMVAMASWVPLGTKVRITCPSYPSINGVYTVADRGGAIKGSKVDVFMTSHSQAVEFGRRQITIEILD